MSVRKVLENFLAHVKKLEAAEEEGGKGNFSREFQYLKKKSGIYLRDGTYPAKEGEKRINRVKNRYKDILPFDYTRVSLNPINGEEGSDYINANFLKGVTSHPAYIAAQGPLPGTVNDFWRMIWQYDVKIVVMASNEYEAGKTYNRMQHKCQRYWPVEDEEKHFLDMKVTLVEEESHSEFVVRKINVEKEEENRTILQFHYTSWPDHGVPSSTRPMLDMIALVREYQSGHEPPIVIHCSAGCGRTGTICAIDYAWNLLKTGKLASNFSLYKIISEMRRQRPSIVQAKDQYVIAHKAVSELFERHLDMMNQHFYENVEFKGQPLSPGGESPSSDTGQMPYDSSYEDLAGPTSPIVRIELAPPSKILKRRSMIVENATSPTHKAVKSTVAQIIKSESDNDLKAGTSQLTCATPTLETKFSFELEDLDNVPSSPTKITVTDGDSLAPESSRSDMLTSSSHSAESGYSSNVSGSHVAKAPSSEELELSSHVTNIHISGKGDSQVSYQQQHTFQDKTVTQVFDDPRRLDLRGEGHLSPVKGHTSHRLVRLPGSHERETCTDDMDIPGLGDGGDPDADDVVFEDNPLYSTSSSANDQPRNVPTNMDGLKNSHITSPKKIKDIVSEMNRSISEESAHDPRSNQTHSKKSPVKVAPKPTERKLSVKRQGVVEETEMDEGDYVDVVVPKSHGNVNGDRDTAQVQSEYVYAEAYATDDSPIKSALAQPGQGGYCYVGPTFPRNPLQAAAQKILTETQQNEFPTGSTGAKPKTVHHSAAPGGKKPPVKVPAKPPRKKPSTNVFNKDYEDVEAMPEEGAYEPVAVQNTSSRGIPKSTPRNSAEEGHRLHPVAYRRQDGGSSGSSAEDVYAMVESRPHVSTISQESTDSDDAPAVPPKTPRTYESSSEESLTNQLPDLPEDLIKSTAGAVRTLGRVFKKKVQQAFGASTWPLPNDKAVNTPAVVIFKDKDISYGKRVSRPAGPRNTSNFTPMPAPRFK